MPIPTLTLRLLDIQMPNEPDTRKLLLNGAKDLLGAHTTRVNEEGINMDIFHNQNIVYSGIQLGRYQRSPEWTAIGGDAVKALQLWYQLFREESPHLLRNTVEIRENFTPEFLPYQKKYRVRPLLISDELAKSLNEITDKFMRYDRLEKYLYGNLMTFFQYIQFDFNKDRHFLKINVLDAPFFNRALPVYHQQKKTAFDIVFKCNFRLPQTLRLGQSTALGYGKVVHL